MKIRSRILATVALTTLATAAQAEWEISFYLGYQTAPHSDIEGTVAGIGDFDEFITWEGRPFDPPPYYGLRASRWVSETTGWAFELNHAKVYADEDEAAAAGFERLEFTDGINIVTVNYMRRYPDLYDRIVPYYGVGAGLSIPHVDVETSASKTFEYQVTGPAVAWLVGASYPVNDRWAVFGEYKGTYSMNEADLDGGGELKTDLITNAINFGVSYSF